MSLYDPLASNQNKLFNWQKFTLTEILPEEEEKAVGPASSGGTGVDRPLSQIEPFSIPSGISSSRSSPWDLGLIDGASDSVPFVNEIIIPIFDVPVGDPFEWVGNKLNSLFFEPTRYDPTEEDFKEDQKALDEALEKKEVEEPAEVTEEMQTVAKPKPVSFQADVLSSEVYNYTAQVSSSPTDAIGEITDHFNSSPMTMQVSAVHSDNVFSYIDSISNIINSPVFQGASDLIQSVGRDFFDVEDENNDPVIRSRTAIAFNQLVKWHRTGQPLKVFCKYAPLGFKDDQGREVPFVIQTLSIPRDSQVGKAIRISMTLREIQVVEIAKVSAIAYDQSELSKAEAEENKIDEDKTNVNGNTDNLPACLVNQGGLTPCGITSAFGPDGKPLCSIEKAKPAQKSCKIARDKRIEQQAEDFLNTPLE